MINSKTNTLKGGGGGGGGVQTSNFRKFDFKV